MSKKRYKKEKSFFDYSLKYRKQQTFRIKNEIRLFNIYNRSSYNFVSYDMLSSNDGPNYWSDITFLSRKDNNIFYNAEIVTCQYNLIEMITDEAYDYVCSKLPERYIYDFDKHVELDDMTVDECVQNYIDNKLKTRPQTYEEYRLYEDFRCGVGVTLIVDVNNLTCDIINECVNHFLDNGEISWKNSEPAKNIEYVKDWRGLLYTPVKLNINNKTIKELLHVAEKKHRSN